MAEDRNGRFRGGKMRGRDSWYGLEGLKDFDHFKRWWHRSEKPRRGGQDIAGREQARDLYDEWVAMGRPGGAEN